LSLTIKNLTIKDSKDFFEFIKKQDKSDLSLFTRWKSCIDSDKLLTKFVDEECKKNPVNGIRIIARTNEGKICGFGLIDFFTDISKQHVAIVGTVTDKSMRNIGIGKDLLQREIEIGQKFKKKKLRATVHEHNIPSLKLHSSLGFQQEGKFVAEEYDGEYRNVLSLALFLK
jgi:RimJ/RimL family protein N-acetyltransferase